MSPSPRARRATAALLSVTVIAAWWAAPAAAHGDEGIMEIIAVESPSPLEISLEVGVLYANDDDPAPDAAVSVTATGPDGASVGPIDVPNVNDGVYATTFDVPSPGTWSLAVASTAPTAEVSGTVSVTGGDPTTSAPETTTTAGDTTTSEASTTTTDPDTTAAPTTGPATDLTSAADIDGGSDDESSPNLVPLLLAAVAVVAIGAVIVLARRGRDDATGTDATGTDATGADAGGSGPGGDGGDA